MNLQVRCWLPVAACLVISGLLRAQPNPVPPPTVEFPAELQQYLELTEEQAKAIGDIVGADQVRASAAASKLLQIRETLRQLRRQTPYDEARIADLNAEAERILREGVLASSAARSQVTEKLTEPQRAKLKVLMDAQALFPRVREAVCMYLLPGDVRARPLASQNQGGAPLSPEFADRQFRCPQVARPDRLLPQ